jgi:hypothetical protein
MAAPPTIAVERELVLRIFNHHYLPLVMSGQLREDVRDRGPASPASQQPPGTESIFEDYWDDDHGLIVASAHYFWLPEAVDRRWRIGGSGVPDPKRVYWHGVMLYVQE